MSVSSRIVSPAVLKGRGFSRRTSAANKVFLKGRGFAGCGKIRSGSRPGLLSHITPAESTRALQAAEKLDPEGRGVSTPA
jgi:hypothetical protein